MSRAQARQYRRRGMQDGTYWPGYVDALINVVLNLMFLVAMLAVGSFVMGMQISRTVMAPVTEAPTRKEQKSAPVVDEVITIGPREDAATTIDVIDSTAPYASWGIRVDQERNVENQALLQIRFAPDALRLTDSSRVNLLPRLRRLSQQHPGASFAIWAVSGPDPEARRVSFMRIMALREAMNSSGIDNRRLVTRILQGSNKGTSGQLVYVLVRPTQNKNETDEQ